MRYFRKLDLMKTMSTTTNSKTLAKTPNLETKTQKEEVAENFPKLKSPLEGLGTATVGKGKKSEGTRSSIEDRDEVIFSGPYTMSSRPVIVKAWYPNFNFNNEVLRMIPLWVKLPNLPLNCWGQGLIKQNWKCTSCIDRISFVRILVEIDITQVLPTHVKVQDPNGRMFEQSIKYEWKPSYTTKKIMNIDLEIPT
ncbi:hypothetical protein H5410_052535 [Solanum commersonii]|uniref:DUF4283 domain-containing protein n=1 Tax=Solanum commersonii TaxID=4109 RepID=A0A9J5X3N5_SOLCO|nr:hypothetical protein H5410_052535 [Solanum commersonii]